MKGREYELVFSPFFILRRNLMRYLLDTNILIDYPEILEHNNINDIPIVVSYLTIEELDWLKESKNNEVAFKARRASHYLLKYFNNVIFDTLTKVDREKS